jgi:hypothetical protein
MNQEYPRGHSKECVSQRRALALIDPLTFEWALRSPEESHQTAADAWFQTLAPPLYSDDLPSISYGIVRYGTGRYEGPETESSVECTNRNGRPTHLRRAAGIDIRVSERLELNPRPPGHKPARCRNLPSRSVTRPVKLLSFVFCVSSQINCNRSTNTTGDAARDARPVFDEVTQPSPRNSSARG